MKTVFALFISVLMLATSANAASVRMSGTEIVGIDNLDINGTLWDATFSDISTSTFYTADFALNASNALLSLFNAGGIFDDQYIDYIHDTSVVGFYGSAPYGFNAFYTSYGLNGVSPGATNGYAVKNSLYPNYNNDIVYFSTGSLGSSVGFVTNVDWQESNPTVSAVPVPAAAFLFAPALLGFLGLRRKSRA